MFIFVFPPLPRSGKDLLRDTAAFLLFTVTAVLPAWEKRTRPDSSSPRAKQSAISAFRPCRHTRPRKRTATSRGPPARPRAPPHRHLRQPEIAPAQPTALFLGGSDEKSMDCLAALPVRENSPPGRNDGVRRGQGVGSFGSGPIITLNTSGWRSGPGAAIWRQVIRTSCYFPRCCPTVAEAALSVYPLRPKMNGMIYTPRPISLHLFPLTSIIIHYHSLLSRLRLKKKQKKRKERKEWKERQRRVLKDK